MANVYPGHLASRALPMWRSLLILIWGTSLEIVVASPRIGLWIAALVCIATMWVVGRWTSRMPGWARAVLTLWVCAASLVTLLVAAGPVIRQLMIGLSLVAFTLTLLAESESENPKLHGRIAAVAILFVLVASYFCLLTFGTGIFLVIQPWWLVLSSAIVTMGLSALGWSAAEVPFKKYARGLPLAALIGAELMLVVWWLPTAVYVGSMVAATITSLWIQTTRHVWRGDWEAGRGRRYLAIGGSVTAALLITARWI